MSQFLKELRRRRVFRTAAVYIIAAWVVFTPAPAPLLAAPANVPEENVPVPGDAHVNAGAVDGSITAMLVSRTLNAGGYWDLVFEVNTTSIANSNYTPCGGGLIAPNCRVKAHAPGIITQDIIDIAITSCPSPWAADGVAICKQSDGNNAAVSTFTVTGRTKAGLTTGTVTFEACIYRGVTVGLGCEQPGGSLTKVEVVVDLTSADLSLTKVAVGAPAAPLLGDVFDYVLEVSNAGPSDATNVMVTDPLPPQLAFVGSDCGMVEGQPGILTWSVGTLVAGDMVGCTLTVEVVNFSDVIINTASADSDTADTGTGNNTAGSQEPGAIPIIPTLGPWGMLLLLLGLVSIGAWWLRRS